MRSHISETHQRHDPAARAWIRATDELFAGYCQDVHGYGPSRCGLDAIVIDIAARQLWEERGDEPCWSKLDVQRWLDSVAGKGGDQEGWQHTAVITLNAFYCFLVKHHHLSRSKALKVVDQLEPLTARAMEHLLPQLIATARAEASRSPSRPLH